MTLILYEYNNIKTYKLYDIIFLFSGGKRSSTKNLLSQQQHLYTDLYKESTDDEKDDNHYISLNKKQTSSASSNTWRKSNKHISFSQYKVN